MEYRNQYEMKFVALVRSGHHAVMNWIMRHFDDKDIVFLNSIRIGKSPFDEYGVHENQFEESKEELINRSKDLLIYNFERHRYRLSEVFSKEWEDKRDDMVGKSVQRYNCLVLRDPFNNIASKLRIFSNNLPHLIADSNIVEIWKDHAREYLGQTNYLGDNAIYISYNDWFKSQEYRRRLSKRLGLEFTDKGLEFVPVFGEGSSFDKRKLDGKAQQMNVFERWRSYIDHDQYRSIFKDFEIVDLSEEIFGHIAGTEALI